VSTFEYTIYGIRRGWRTSRTFIFAGAFAAALVAGIFSNFSLDSTNKAIPLVLFGFWTLVFGTKAHRWLLADPLGKDATRGRMELELGLLLVVATHAAVQMAGGFTSPLYPLIFVLVAFLVVYTRQWVGFTLVSSALAIEFALVFLSPVRIHLYEVLFHSVFIVFFAIINLIFTRTELARMRRSTLRQIERAKTALAKDARDFRLTTPARHTGSLTRKEEEAHISRSSVSEVKRSMYHHVDLLRRTMRLQTCVLLWLNSNGKTLRILECVSDSDRISTRTIGKGEGAIGAILQSHKTLCLKGLKLGYGGLPYYEDPVKTTDFMGIPVIDGGTVRGVLCVDRDDNRPFNKSDATTLKAAVESLLNIIANERVFSQLQKAKSEQSKLLAASDELSGALTEQEVVKAALDAAGQITHFDMAAVALVNRDGRQVVREATGSNAEKIIGITPASSGSLAGAALKNRHFLPYRGKFDPKQQILFTKKTQKLFHKMHSAMVLPLGVGNKPLGTLTLTSSSESAYGEEVRTTLQVLSNQLSISLQNARMVKKLEEMATTDGLTGLANHRVFQEELEKKLASATRFNKELSVILCDLDHFKKVNDTYGHPVGDVVIKGLADALKSIVVRDTDLAARYGGEEFVIVCEGTSTQGAVQLAERIRQSMEQQIFHTDRGELNVTLSLGVASFPSHAHTRENLVERADAALYMAKDNGRNKVCSWNKTM
jgi:diguanylate cyclase (GGDEF)-like protein